MTVTPLDQLLMDLDESLDAEGYVPLYTFSWWLRGQKRGLGEDEIAEMCTQAYDEFTRRHSMHLEWFDWPATDLGVGRPAEPGTPLDFDINTTGTIETPFLALVPDQAVST